MKTGERFVAALAALIALMLISSCASGGGPPAPPDPPPPVVRTAPLHVFVRDASGAPIVNARIDINAIDGEDDARSSDTGYWGIVLPLLPACVPDTHCDSYRLEVHAEGYHSAGVDVFFVAEREAIVTLQPLPPPVLKRTGIVRVCGRAFCDDQGAHPALGATLFWGLSGYRSDRATLDANLQWIREELGADYVRILAVVGGGDITPDPWERAGAFLYWDDYWQTLAGFLDHAYDTYGLRTQLTVFGGRAQAPSASAQMAVIDRIAEVVNARPHTIQHLEIANEYWMNGWYDDHATLRALALRLRNRLTAPIAIALSSPRCAADGCPEEEMVAELRSLYGGASGANLWTPHWLRDITRVDGIWKFIRQSWDALAFGCPGALCVPGMPEASTNDEPIGPRSSVADDHNPVTIQAAYIASIANGQAAYVYHSDAGIWSDKLHPHYQGIKGVHRHLADHRNAAEIARRLKLARQNLPPDLANWSRSRHGQPQHPFIGSFGCDEALRTCFQIWPDGHATGVVRITAMTQGNDFFSFPIGIRGDIALTPAYAMTFDIVDPSTWRAVATHTLRPGERAILSGVGETAVVIGRYH